MIKIILDKVNSTLVRYNSLQTPSLWVYWHKWNYQHTLMKNLLQFSNRVLKQINRYHVFRWEWMVGIVGGLTGFVVTQLQQIYYQIKIGYKPTTSDLIIKGVLKNSAVSNKLKDTLDYNVFRNQDIQFYVHQALLNQILNPQKQTIKQLILASIKSLNEKHNVNYFGNLFANNISILKQPIKSNALQFLNSVTMDGITANGIKSVLQGLFFKQFLANQINNSIKAYIGDQKNSQALYQMIKQKVTF